MVLIADGSAVAMPYKEVIGYHWQPANTYLLLHGKAVKQAIPSRAYQRSLAATPGVVG